MSTLTQLIPMVFQTQMRVLSEGLFWVVVALVAVQYRQMARMKEGFTGVKAGKGVFKDTLVACIFGVAGGFAGSLIMVFIGLTLSGSGLIYMWPVAILLMLINARFLCFAYAGGIVALTYLFFGWPQINVPQVIALVAILHMVESLLILGSGHLGAVPAYIKDRSGQIVGGFTLQKFWPIPIVALMAVVGRGVVQDGVDMPSWWPLLNPGIQGDLEHLSYILLPVVAGLGYGDVAVARTPREKSKLSAFYLGLYSFVLLILALLADRSWLLAFCAAVFSPLGHELVIHIGKQVEFNSRPRYVPPERGIMVLDAVPNTPAWRAGLRSGDILVEINGLPVKNKFGLDGVLEMAFGTLELAFYRAGERKYRRGLVHRARGQHLGILPVPEGGEKEYVEISTVGPLGRWWGSFWRKIKGA
ncbi:PDZ domain-containing protein [Desulfolucanica intricata]|uniref:PDZ domain-containing protein n=1 Tax=Desulfolucanica intricata TaxID=1285191 RepID=UPI00082E1D40|nr:PDZ domain-containing protein [Desulfolucanica intricata]